ncbi:aldehyde dehydrogenase family protein, partial [Roseomonas alkaliterrae]
RELLARLAAETKRRAEDIAAAAAADFGARSRIETLLADALLVADFALHARRHLRRWARPRRVGVPYPFWPARARLEPVPKGIVGILAPWNYPFQLALAPAVDAIAAGNRIAVKPSERTPRCAALVGEVLEAALGPRIARCVTGDAAVAADFAAQPWDHLAFTGGTATGRKVAAAAAPNLVPLTLELGGKCPAIILPGAELGAAARAILVGKALNAGQTCVAPDTVLLVGHGRAAFEAACRAAGIPAPETALVDEAAAARLDR